MNEPAAVLESIGSCLHCLVIYRLTVYILCLYDFVDFSMKIAGLGKCADFEESWCDCISVRNIICCCIFAEAVVGYALAVTAEQFTFVIAEDEPILGIILPVVFKSIRQ